MHYDPPVRTIDTDLVECLLLVNNRILQFASQKVFRDAGITPAQFNTLGIVIRHHILDIKTLKSYLIVSVPALSQMFGRMERLGLIEREIDPHDRRKISLRPTQKGVRMYHQLNERYTSIAREKLLSFSVAEKEHMLDLLLRMEHILSK